MRLEGISSDAQRKLQLHQATEFLVSLAIEFLGLLQRRASEKWQIVLIKNRFLNVTPAITTAKVNSKNIFDKYFWTIESCHIEYIYTNWMQLGPNLGSNSVYPFAIVSG